MTLLDTQAIADSPAQSEQRRAMVVQSRTGSFEKILRGALGALLHPAHRSDPVFQTLVRMGLDVGVESMQRQVEAIIARVDSRPFLAHISVPTLIAVGDADVITPLDRSEEMAALIPGATLAVIPECGHASTLEQPHAVNRALIEWLTA